MTVELVEIEPGKWRVKRPRPRLARSDLPRPYVISDIMEPTEQVDGRFYTSKRAFRAVGRNLGLTEVGNEKFKPKVRGSVATAGKRRDTIGNTIAQYRAGRRAKTGG